MIRIHQVEHVETKQVAAAKIIPITSDDEIDDFVVEVCYLFLIGVFFDGCV